MLTTVHFLLRIKFANYIDQKWLKDDLIWRPKYLIMYEHISGSFFNKTNSCLLSKNSGILFVSCLANPHTHSTTHEKHHCHSSSKMALFTRRFDRKHQNVNKPKTELMESTQRASLLLQLNLLFINRHKSNTCCYCRNEHHLFSFHGGSRSHCEWSAEKYGSRRRVLFQVCWSEAMNHVCWKSVAKLNGK